MFLNPLHREALVLDAKIARGCVPMFGLSQSVYLSNFRELVLGGTEVQFRNQIIVGKLCTRSFIEGIVWRPGARRHEHPVVL